MDSNLKSKQVGIGGFFLLLICIATISVAQQQPAGWTPDVMIKFKRVGGTAISPNGDLVAYSVSTPLLEGEKSEYLTHIWIVSTEGKINQQFTRGEKSCTNPAFSPDEKYLSFMSSRGEKAKTQVWLIPLNGGEAEQLTKAKSGLNSYIWSNDGNRIAYTMNDPETKEEEKDKKEKRDMKVLDTNYKNAHLYTTTVAKDSKGERKVQRLTSGDFHVTDFSWSSDGRSIAFAHQVNPTVDAWPTTDISSVPSDSGEVTAIVTWKGRDNNPLYSPDGKWLAFVSDGGEPRWARATDVYIMPAKGGEPKKLSPTPDRRPQLVSWSDDSKHVYFNETDHTSRRLFVLPINGNAPRAKLSGPGNFTGASLSANGKMLALIHQTPETAPDVYITPAQKIKLRKLTNVNADFPKLQMARTEVITWKSKDGMEIEGLLTYPIYHELDKQYPLILNIHGGPAGVYTQSFTGAGSIYPIQAFAQEGYAILKPNPRGSSGYGKDFRFANYNDWGFGDYDDLIAGVNKVIGMGVAHPDSLCVMGWSYGGFMTSFIVTKSNRFKAASVGAGVTNLMSFTGTSDISGFLPDYFGGEPWDRIDAYMKHSAMFNIKAVNIPTQIIHGEQDIRVPLSQGLELYNALKRQGCPTEMIVYPRTPHGPREPKFIIDIGERIIAWFNKHLGRTDSARPVVEK